MIYRKCQKYLMLSLTMLTLMPPVCSGTEDVNPECDLNSESDVVNPEPAGKLIVIAHRGASGYLPEHTLAAYELAIKMNADYIEPDLQFTSDGHLVVMHESTLDRTTNVANFFAKRNGHTDYPVSDFTLAEIKMLMVLPQGTAKTTYSCYAPSMANPFKIPTFEEVIVFVKEQSAKTGRAIGIYLEAKQAGSDMEDSILSALAAHGMDNSDILVFIQSFNAATILNLHRKQQEQGTHIPLILLGNAVMDNGIAKIASFNMLEVKEFADGIGVNIDSPTKEWIDQAHAAGLKVHVWTFSRSNATEALIEYQQYLNMGIDGIFSDYPDLAVLGRNQFNLSNGSFTADEHGGR